MKELLLQIFTWWNGQTMGTRFFTWRKGEKVGEDNQGNVYYRSADDRRWVIYNGAAEASRIPPGWHGWIHHRTNEVPDKSYEPREWQQAHKANPTGTAEAYRPDGSLYKPQASAEATRSYQAWQPE